MYRQKIAHPCAMPAHEGPLHVLVLNASLKHEDGKTPSNTEGIAKKIIEEMRAFGPIESEIVRLADHRIDVGLGFKESDQDEWPDIAAKIRTADVIIFATPIWWGGMSSLMQRVIERMDAFDEEILAGGRAALLNKVATIAITGSEDGAQAVMAKLLSTLSFLNFTIPPQCCTYWVGEVGLDPATDAERREKSSAIDHMAKMTARNASYYAYLLKAHPLAPYDR